MALSNNEKLAIKAQLKLGGKPKDVAEQFSTNVQNVYGLLKEVKRDQEAEVITDLQAIPEEVVAHIVEEAKKELPIGTPSQTAPTIQAFDAVVDGLDGLKKLDKAFQTTMSNVLSRFDEMLKDKEMPLKEIIQVANTTASAYEKVFSSGTNIHIGDNNQHSNNQLTVFQNKKGV